MIVSCQFIMLASFLTEIQFTYGLCCLNRMCFIDQSRDPSAATCWSTAHIAALMNNASPSMITGYNKETRTLFNIHGHLHPKSTKSLSSFLVIENPKPKSTQIFAKAFISVRKPRLVRYKMANIDNDTWAARQRCAQSFECKGAAYTVTGFKAKA